MTEWRPHVTIFMRPWQWFSCARYRDVKSSTGTGKCHYSYQNYSNLLSKKEKTSGYIAWVPWVSLRLTGRVPGPGRRRIASWSPVTATGSGPGRRIQVALASWFMICLPLAVAVLWRLNLPIAALAAIGKFNLHTCVHVSPVTIQVKNFGLKVPVTIVMITLSGSNQMHSFTYRIFKFNQY